MEKYGFVYLWFDEFRKMYYVGCHWGTETDGCICSSNRMRNAYRRRPKNFKRRILARIYTNKSDMLKEEYKWLSMIKPHELKTKYYNVYNHHFKHWSSDKFKTELMMEKISKANKGRKQSPESIQKMIETKRATGKLARSEETKRKLSKAHKGKILSEETKEKLRRINTGKKLSEETKAKIKANHKRDYSCPEFRRKISEAAKNRSPEHRRKISENAKRLRASGIIGRKSSNLHTI